MFHFLITPYPSEINESLLTAWDSPCPSPVDQSTSRATSWMSTLKKLVLSGYCEIASDYEDAMVRAAQIASSQGRSITVALLSEPWHDLLPATDIEIVAIAEPQTGDNDQLRLVF